MSYVHKGIHFFLRVILESPIEQIRRRIIMKNVYLLFIPQKGTILKIVLSQRWNVMIFNNIVFYRLPRYSFIFIIVLNLKAIITSR